MLIELSEEEVKGILTYMYYGINECGEIGNTEQNAYTKLYNHLKSLLVITQKQKRNNYGILCRCAYMCK